MPGDADETEALSQAMSQVQLVDARAFSFLLKRVQELKRECDEFKHSSVESKVLDTSRRVARITAEAKSNASVTLNSKLKMLLPKPDKIDALRLLLLANPTAIDTWRDTITGSSMLHVAAEAGNLPAVQLLVEEQHLEQCGDDLLLYAVDLAGRTALHLAAWKQFMPVCEYLTRRMGGAEAVLGERAPQDMAGFTPAALSALAMNSFDYDPDKQREYEEVRRSVKRFLHVKGDACVSPRRVAALNRSANSKGRSRLREEHRTVVSSTAVPFGVFLMNGWGIKMEDFCFAASPVGGEDADDDSPVVLLHAFAVFDGHGGALCAKECSETLLPRLLATQSLIGGEGEELAELATNLVQGMEVGLQAMPQFAWREIELRPAMGAEPAVREWQVGDGSGTTCVLALLTAELVCVAHVGDSRAAFISLGEEEEGGDVALTRDHKLKMKQGGEEEEEDAFSAGERARIERAGGFVAGSQGTRVSVDREGKTSLGMTRSLGDFWAKNRSGGESVVSAEPEVWVAARAQYQHGVLALASDGVWDVLSERELGQFVRRRLKEEAGRSDDDDAALVLQRIASDVCDFCLDADSQDNMSVILVDLRLLSPLPSSPLRRPVFE